MVGVLGLLYASDWRIGLGLTLFVASPSRRCSGCGPWPPRSRRRAAGGGRRLRVPRRVPGGARRRPRQRRPLLRAPPLGRVDAEVARRQARGPDARLRHGRGQPGALRLGDRVRPRASAPCSTGRAR
jgi:hypothetical protein